MTRPKLTLFVDIVSPFAYLAFYITRVGHGSYSQASTKISNFLENLLRRFLFPILHHDLSRQAPNVIPLNSTSLLYSGIPFSCSHSIADSPSQHSPVFKQCDLSYVPIFLGGVMKACGNTAPINIKSTSAPTPSNPRTACLTVSRQRQMDQPRASALGPSIQHTHYRADA